MNERLTIQDLTDLLAAKHSMTKKDAEAFVKEFFLLIEQALKDEKTVKIKGLGTFKLIDVDSRESVNVNTGERFQIKGHTKVSFSPDPNLRDTINKPFAHFETVVLNENTILEDTPVEETEEEESGEENIVQIIEETIVVEPAITEEVVELQPEEQPLTETPIEEIVENGESEQEETPVIEQEEQQEEKITAEQIIEQELLKANLKPENPTISSQPEVVVNPSGPVQDVIRPVAKKDVAKKEKSPVPYLITVIVIVLLLCGSVVLFIYYPDLFSDSSDKSALNTPPVTTQPVQPEIQLPDTIERKDTIAEVTVATATTPKTVVKPQPVASTTVYLDSASYKITGTKTKYTIKEGETLTRVSLRFYGTKAMWPYIVKHNQNVIKNPDNVPYGTTIKIPELTKE